MREALYGLGAVFEFIGIVLIAFPDFVPGARRAGAWLRVHIRREADRILRLLRRPRHQVIRVGTAESMAMAHGASFTKAVRADATLDERVAFLLQRDQEAQRDMNELGARVAAIEKHALERLNTLRDELRAHVATEIATADAEYRPLRIVGTIALAIGLGLSTAGNLVS